MSLKCDIVSHFHYSMHAVPRHTKGSVAASICKKCFPDWKHYNHSSTSPNVPWPGHHPPSPPSFCFISDAPQASREAATRRHGGGRYLGRDCGPPRRRPPPQTFCIWGACSPNACPLARPGRLQTSGPHAPAHLRAARQVRIAGRQQLRCFPSRAAA